MLESIKIIFGTLLGLVCAAVKSFAIIILPAVLLASGVTAVFTYIIQ